MKWIILFSAVGIYLIYRYEKNNQVQYVYINTPIIGDTIAPPPLVIGDPGTLSIAL